MPDESTADSTATSDSTAATSTETQAETTTDDSLGDAGKAAIKRERDARKAAEKSLKEVQDKLTAIEGKDKSDVERLTGERDKLKADLETRETRLRDLAVTNALTQAATKAGARYPDLLVDRLSKRAELDDDLTATNADALVAEAKKAYPDLFRTVEGGADGGKDDQDDSAAVKPGLGRLQRAYAATDTSKSRTR